MERKRKLKGGAERLRERKRLLLASDVETCSELSHLFKGSGPSPAQRPPIKEDKHIRQENEICSLSAPQAMALIIKESPELTDCSSITYTYKEEKKEHRSMTHPCKEQKETERCSINYTCKEQEENEHQSITYTCKEEPEENERSSITYTCKEEPEENERCSITHTCKEELEGNERCSITYTCKEEQEENERCSITYTSKEEPEENERCSITYICKEEPEENEHRSITHTCKEEQEENERCSITYTCKEEQEENERCSITYTCKEQEENERCSITYTCKEQEENECCSITYTCKEQEENGRCSITYTSKEEPEENKRRSITYTCKEEPEENERRSITCTCKEEPEENERCSITYTCKEEPEENERRSITYTCKEEPEENEHRSITCTCKEEPEENERCSITCTCKEEPEENERSSVARPSMTYTCRDKRPEDTKNSSVEATTSGRTQPGLSEVRSAEWQTSKAIDLFVRPKKNERAFFFQSHPIQPFEDPSLPFAPKNVFLRKNGSRREWVSYSKSANALYCTVCLAYSKANERSVFIEGMKAWAHTGQRINEHETSKRHKVCAEIHMQALKKEDVGFSEPQEKKREQIEHNRAVMEMVVEVIKLVGRRGLSYGASDAAYALCDSLLDHENFLEFLILLSKYDPGLKTHLEKCQQAHESGSTGRERALTFFSKTTITNVLQVIASLIKKSIADEVREAGMFSVQLDATQDISAKDQCSVIIRYVDKLKGAQERLLAVVSGADLTRRGSLELMKETLKTHGLDIGQCIGIGTDGAANLQGVYDRFSAWLGEKSPERVHVWCYNHALNLWIAEVTRSPIAAASLFYLLKMVAVFLRDAYKKERGADRHRRLQTICETHWWTEDVILTQIFGSFDDPSTSLYVDVILSLDTIEVSEKDSSDLRAKARSYKEGLLRYETIMTAFVYLRVFQLTTPMSKYLQTVGIDLLKAHQMAMSTSEQLEKIKRDVEKVRNKVDDFVEWVTEEFDKRSPTHDIVIEDFFPDKAVRKRTPGEAASEDATADAYKDFEVGVYNRVLDTAVESLKARFGKNEMLCCNLAWMSPARFGEIKTSLPRDALQKLSEVLAAFDVKVTNEQLRSELVSLANNWDRLKSSLPEEYLLNNLQENDEEPEHNEKKSVHTRCRKCVVCVYLTLERYNLFTEAYQNVGLAYKYLLTLPTTHVACEGSTSVLRMIKNRLRRTRGAEHVEAFLLMAVEKDVLQRIEPDVIMANVALKSTQLHKELYPQ